MAGTPSEEPTKFVCMSCHNVLAGIPTDEEPPYKHYEAPQACGACGSEEVVLLSKFDRHWARHNQ